MSSSDTTSVEFKWGVKIDLRDGVQLNATVYLPNAARSPLPCVLAITPYTSDVYHADGMYFARHGLPFVVVDSRGRGNSGGEFHPYCDDAHDGFDVVEWLAEQPYCNGRVAMFGGSYSGYTQWVTAKEFPRHLASLVPIAASFAGGHAPMRNNIFYPERLRWLALVGGHTHRGRVHADSVYWSSVSARWHESGKSFRKLDVMAGYRSATFQEWLSHPEPDTYWDSKNPTVDEYKRISLPILTITGAYDVDQPGALAHYKQHIAVADPQDRDRHFLVIGPWNHSGAQFPRAQFGGLSCGPASVVDMRKLHRDWYAWTLEGGPRPEFLKQNVSYYVTGSEIWRYADTLDTVTIRHEPYFLDSQGEAIDVLHSGALGFEMGSGPADSYTYDPRDTRGLEVAAELRADDQSLFDQSQTHALRGRQLVYKSDPFDHAVEVSGFFRLEAWISIDCPDTDFYVSIYEVSATGEVLILSSDVMRARYREGLRDPRLIDTADPLLYRFETFTFVARRIDRGCRLRLVIAPFGRIDSTFVQKNYNGGGIVAEESVTEARPVTVSLFHDATHPSVLYVPLGRSESDHVG